MLSGKIRWKIRIYFLSYCTIVYQYVKRYNILNYIIIKYTFYKYLVENIILEPKVDGTWRVRDNNIYFRHAWVFWGLEYHLLSVSVYQLYVYHQYVQSWTH